MLQKVLLGILCCFIGLQELQAKETYKILGKPPLGSKFKPIEAKSPVPFDKKYSQFTAEQQFIYRSFFSGLEEGDTPPFPKRRLRGIYKPLIKGHERIARGGFLRLIAKINHKGEVEEVSVYESPSKAMTQLANSVFFTTEFEPPVCAREDCTVDFQFEFELRDRSKAMKSLSKEDFE